MGFIDEAIQYGYKAEQILNMIGTHNPKFKEKINEAVKYGYTPASILRDIAGIFKSDRGKKAAKVLGVNPKFARNLAFSKDLDPAYVIPEQMQPEPGDHGTQDTIGNIAGAGIGAAAGFAAGGPVGAVSGAIGGSEAYQQLVDRYREKNKQGKHLSFPDFVKSLAIAASKGTATGFSTKFLMDILNKMGGSEQEKEGANIQTVPTEEVDQTEEILQDQGNEEEIKKSYEVINNSPMGSLLSKIPEELTPIETMKLGRKMFGTQFIKDIERERKKPFEDVYEEFKQYKQEEPQEEVQESQVEEIEEDPDKDLVERKITKGESEPFEPSQSSVLNGIFKSPKQDAKSLKGKAKPIPGANKSSNVIGTFYNPDTKEMRAVFGSGGVYTYPNVELEDFQNVVGGKAKPITEGENTLGFWYRKKDKSSGAAFDKYIKKQKEKYPHTKLEPSQYTLPEKQILTAKRTFLASDFFEPFKKQRKRGRHVEKGKALKDMESSLKEMDDDFVGDIVEYIEEQLKGVLKNPPTVSRLQKEYKKRF